jgi:glucan 1,3-beta-glucosidase
LDASPNTTHTGLFIESGSGGLLNDLYFYGGGKAAVLGNQQYTARNVWFSNADIAIFMPWDWGWTFKSMYFNNCSVGIQMSEQANSTGSITVIDSWFNNVGTAIFTTRNLVENLGTNGTLVIENTNFTNVGQPIVGPSGTILSAENTGLSQDLPFFMASTSL